MKGRIACAKKKGGAVEKGVNDAKKDKSPSEVYAGKGSDVVKEAKKRADGGKVDGEAGPRRMDRPGRKRGGRIGADTSPLSSAARIKEPAGRTYDREND